MNKTFPSSFWQLGMYVLFTCKVRYAVDGKKKFAPVTIFLVIGKTKGVFLLSTIEKVRSFLLGKSQVENKNSLLLNSYIRNYVIFFCVPYVKFERCLRSELRNST